MLLLVAKAAVSGAMIVVANVIANRLSPSLGGWVAAFPLISFLTVAWLWFDGGSGTEATGLLLSVVVMTRNGVPLLVSMFLGTAIWVLFTLVAVADRD